MGLWWDPQPSSCWRHCRGFSLGVIQTPLSQGSFSCSPWPEQAAEAPSRAGQGWRGAAPPPLPCWGIPCRETRWAGGEAPFASAIFQLFHCWATLPPPFQAPHWGSQVLPHILRHPKGTPLISHAAHGAQGPCNGLNLTTPHFNYGCVRTESVA